MDFKGLYELVFGGYNPIQKGLVIFTVVMFSVLYAIDPEKGRSAVATSGETFINVLLLILAGVLLGFIIQIVVPKDLIARVLGEESGLLGILISTGLGGLMPGGPYVVYPVPSSLYAAGADLPPIISFIFAWSAIAMGRIPFELAFFNTRIVTLRILVGIPLPIIAGILARLYLSIFS